jgi:hypothetical protein
VVEINLSPKQSALAYDEVKEYTEESQSVGFEPEINLIINKLSVKKSSSSHIVAIGGKVTVSF